VLIVCKIYQLNGLAGYLLTTQMCGRTILLMSGSCVRNSWFCELVDMFVVCCVDYRPHPPWLCSHGIFSLALYIQLESCTVMGTVTTPQWWGQSLRYYRGNGDNTGC